MARTRNIKPGFFKNEQLAELPMAARLLFAGLWTIADRDGRLEDRPKRIKAEVFPYDNQPIDRLLSALEKSGFITRYAVGESRFISIPTWCKHQNPHVKEPASTIPAPGLSGASTGQEPNTAPDKNSSSPALTLNPSMGSNHGKPVTPIPADLTLPSDAIDLNANGTVSSPHGDLCSWYERVFKGEWLPDTWQSFGRYVDGDSAGLFRANLPLWMKTRKYCDGFGVNSVKFLSSGIWKKPPNEALLPPEARNSVNAEPEIIPPWGKHADLNAETKARAEWEAAELAKIDARKKRAVVA